MVVSRLGLRWLLPALLTPVSAALYWYGETQDRIARATAEKAGWHFGAAWHPNSLVQTIGSVNLPAMLGGALLSIWLPELVVYVIVFGGLVPVLWWSIGRWSDVEYGLGHALGAVRPPLHERPVTLSCGISAILLVIVGILGRTFSPRFLGFFWVVLLPVSLLTGVAKWRRQRLAPH
jgi:hypothetical protein